MRRKAILFVLFLGLVLGTVSAQSISGDAVPSPRFVDNGNGTVTDRLTGLMWEQVPSSTKMTWRDALSYAEGLRLAGYADWRIPYRVELSGIVMEQLPSWADWLNSQGFQNIQPVDYWTATHFSYLGFDYAWYVSMSKGHMGSSLVQERQGCVWVVRGEPKG